MLRFVALHQWFKLGWIAQQFVNCSVGLGDRLIRSESMFVLEVQRYRATSGFSVIAMNEDGGKREPQKIPPFRIVEFLGGGPRHDDPPKATASI